MHWRLQKAPVQRTMSRMEPWFVIAPTYIEVHAMRASASQKAGLPLLELHCKSGMQRMLVALRAACLCGSATLALQAVTLTKSKADDEVTAAWSFNQHSTQEPRAAWLCECYSPLATPARKAMFTQGLVRIANGIASSTPRQSQQEPARLAFLSMLQRACQRACLGTGSHAVYLRPCVQAALGHARQAARPRRCLVTF